MKKRFLSAIVLIVVLSLLALAPKLLWPYISKEQRTARLIEQGQVLAEEGLEDEAAETFRKAAAVGSRDPGQMLALSKQLAGTDPDMAKQLIREILLVEQVDYVDLLEAAKGTIALKMKTESKQVFDRLLAMKPGEPRALKLSGTAALVLENDGAKAARLFEQALAQGSEDSDLKLAYGQLLASSDAIVDKIRAKVLLMEASRSADASGMAALVALLTSRDLPLFNDDYVDFVSRLEQHPDYDLDKLAENPDLVLLLASRFQQYRPTGLYEVVKRLAEDPNCRREVKTAFIFLGQQSGKADEVEAVLGSLNEQGPDGLTVRLLKANQKLLKGEADSALEIFTEIDRQFPGNADLLKILVGGLSNSNLGLRDEVRARMIELVLGNPAADAKSRLDSLGMKLQLFPDKKMEIVDQAVDLMQGNPIYLADWLLRVGEFERAKSLISEAAALTDPILLDLRFRALLQLGNIKEARQLISQGSGRLDPVDVSIYNTMLASLSRKADDFGNSWDQAFKLSAVKEGGFQVIKLARIAYLKKDGPRAIRAFETAATQSNMLGQRDWNDFLVAALWLKDTARAAEIARSAYLQFPDNEEFLNNCAYLAFLLKKDVEVYVESMTQLVQKNPQNPTFRVTLSLGYLLGGFPSKANETLEGISLDLSPAGEAPPKAVYAAVMAANGQRGLASLIVEKLDRSLLLDEEWALVSDLIQ